MGQQTTRLLWGSETPAGRGRAVCPQMAIDSNESKMTLKDLAGGQLVAYNPGGKNLVNSKHRRWKQQILN